MIVQFFYLIIAEIECGVLPAPHNGQVSFNGTTLWSEAVYSCNPGYVLRFGDEIRTCIRRGVWSGREPCCIRKLKYTVPLISKLKSCMFSRLGTKVALPFAWLKQNIFLSDGFS